MSLRRLSLELVTLQWLVLESGAAVESVLAVGAFKVACTCALVWFGLVGTLDVS